MSFDGVWVVSLKEHVSTTCTDVNKELYFSVLHGVF